MSPDDQPQAKNETGAAKPRRQLYGRAKGKALRPAQSQRLAEILPRIQIDLDKLKAGPAALFPVAPKRVVLEIGFGGGEHLAAMAKSEPESGFLGVEPFLNGVAKLLGQVETDNIENLRLCAAMAVRCSRAFRMQALMRSICSIPIPGPSAGSGSAGLSIRLSWPSWHA